MKKTAFWLLLSLLSITSIYANTKKGDEALFHLYCLAGKSFNYSSSIPEDSILTLCKKLETVTRDNQDYDNLFIIQQITVNTYCLKGDVGLAVNKAQQMYKEAKGIDSSVGLALSLQAIADTYISSNQYEQGYATFNEAYSILNKTDKIFLKIRLLMQQMHASMLMENPQNMQRYLVEVSKLLDHEEIPCKQDYIFYLQCYQTFYNIAIKNEELSINLDKVRLIAQTDSVFNRLYYYLCSRYSDLIGEYTQALAYCDSTLNIVAKSGNLNEYKNIMVEKAALLAKNNEKEEACGVYIQVRNIADSLNMTRYSKQIDSLRISYWVDQMALENATMHNQFLERLIAGASLLLLIAIALIYIAKKKNWKLIQSRKKLEEVRQETAASIQSKSLFLSNMSHELRTPLNAIVGFADLLSMEAVDDEESKQQFGERIKQNADLLLRLFNDVADLSALKGKNMKFKYDTCEIVALCQNVIDTVENVKKTAATLHFKTSLDKLVLYTDSSRLQQVLINLLVNATKFTTEGTITLILEVDDQKHEAIFTVEDTGCGIPLEKQPHIFERFEKLHEGIQGAGLGLSICQLIIEHVGGNIWIDNKYTQGARFVFTHPLPN